MKLPAEIKQKWIDALRSGKYKQTEGVLYDPETKGFCCLGVLQHCTMDGQVELNYSGKGCNVYAELPSLRFMESIGIKDISNCSAKRTDNVGYLLLDNPIIDELTYMNDAGRSFSSIAGYIEKEVEVV